MSWCSIHRRHEPDNDLIDYPVSDSYLNHYHRQGLTPRNAPDPPDPAPVLLARAVDRLDTLAGALDGGARREAMADLDKMRRETARLKADLARLADGMAQLSSDRRRDAAGFGISNEL